MAEEQKTDLLKLLLRPETPDVTRQLPTGRYKVQRLSSLLGQDVVFSLRGLPYGKVQRLRESGGEDLNVQILLAGCEEPDLRSSQLQEKYGAATPAEAVKALLLPGEIEDLSRAVEQLCGYRRMTIEEVKNA